MLQIALIRQQPDFVKERLRVKNFDASAAIETILSMDERRKKLQLELEAGLAGLNAISKEIGVLMAKGDKAGADEKKKTVASMKSGHGPLQQALDLTDTQLQQLLLDRKSVV